MSKLTNWIMSLSEIITESQAEKLISDMGISRREFPEEWPAKKVIRTVVEDAISQDTPMKKTPEEGMMVSDPFNHRGIQCVQLTSQNPPLVVLVRYDAYRKLRQEGKSPREIFNIITEKAGIIQKGAQKTLSQQPPQQVKESGLIGGKAPEGKRI